MLHLYGGLGGVYSPPKPHAHVAFYFDYLESPLRTSKCPQNFESPQWHQLFPQGEFSSFASFEGVSF